MAALRAEYIEILKKELQTHYVDHLPPLLGKQTPEQAANKQINRALSAFVLQAALGLPANVAAKAVVDDFQDNGLDAIYYEQGKETLHLVQSKLHLTAQFDQGEAESFCTGIRLLVQQEFGAFNANVQGRSAEIEKALGEASKIQLWIVYTGDGVTGAAKTRLQQLLSDPSHGEQERLSQTIKYFGPNEIGQELLARQRYKPVNTDLFVTHAVKVEEPRLTWYGVVRVLDLVALHQKEDKALYEKNVRYYLGSKVSEVNIAIQHTLATEPEVFFYLNNGVTALCSTIDAKDHKAGRRRLRVRGLSVINGAQTVAAAAELMARASPPDIGNATVMLTLIQANADGAFGPRVTRARNSQNVVIAANFVAQDPVQERLRQELQALGISYQVRPEAEASPSDTVVLLSEAMSALAWLSPDPRYPVWLKAGKGDLFDTESIAYRALFPDTLAGSHLCNAVFFHRAVLQLLKRAELSSRGVERLVYRHGQHAIGACYLKRHRQNIRSAGLIDPRDVEGLISASFDSTRQLAADSFPKIALAGPLAFFKSQASTVSYLASLMERSYGLGGHEALPALKVPLNSDKFPSERLFEFMSQKAPQG